jgi:hypothetical protein
VGRGLSRLRATAVLVALLATTAAADDDLIVSGQVDTLAGARNGGGLSVDWVRPREGLVLQVGGAGFRLGEARWAYGTGTVARRLRPALWGTAGLRLGRGEEDGDGWTYLSARGAVQRSFGARFDGEAELQYTDVAHLAGTVAKLAATHRIGTVWSLQLARHQSVAGDLETRLWGYRGERAFGRVRVMAGGAAGHTAPQLLIPGSGGAPGRLREGYVGVTAPMGEQQVTATVGRLTVIGNERWTMAVSYKR